MNDPTNTVITEEPNPLWLPRGSIRSIMALGVLGVTLVMYVTGRAMGPGQELLTSGVVAAYFVVRSVGL